MLPPWHDYLVHPQAPFHAALSAVLEARRFGEADEAAGLVGYQFDPAGYIRDRLGWVPWEGTAGAAGQAEVMEAYTLALRQQVERAAWEAGEVETAALRWWAPGMIIKNRIRIEAGHTVGKTKLAAGLVNHFFDCFVPSIIYTFAPTWEQIHDLLWKEVKADRRGKGLPGRILDLALVRGDNHFAKGRATSDAGGQGTERAQGQHGKFLMFVLDEAEGVADFVYDAVDSMASGGVSVVLMLANPRTRLSRFHKVKSLSTVQSFRISCINHPNVVLGREVVPGAVRREYVEQMIEAHCEPAPAHDADLQTFEVPWLPGTILQPDTEFLFRVLGIAPANMADRTLIPLGRYEASVGRSATDDEATRYAARLGIDAARDGADYGTGYVRHAGDGATLSPMVSPEYKSVRGGHKSALQAARSSGCELRPCAGGWYGRVGRWDCGWAARRCRPGWDVPRVQGV